MLGFPRVYYKKHALTVVCGICVLLLWKYNPGKFSLIKAADESRIVKLQSGCQQLHKPREGENKVASDSMPVTPFVNNIFVNRRYGLLYCSIAKVGCSFWKRVFKVLDETNSQKLHLYDIKGISAHSDIPDSMTLKNTTQEGFKTMLATYMKFIFVRDPFSRLFSAYVDKILVPTLLQANMVKYFMDQKLTTREKLPCNRKVSFGDFSSLLSDAIMHRNYFEYHFSTISSQCQPCKLNFTMVGKMETFLTDVREVFHRAHIDISEVTGDVEDIDTTNEVSCIKDVIERVWKYFFSRSDECLSHVEAAQRLWKHLQIRGFISKNIHLPLSEGTDNVFSLENYTSVAVGAYEQSEPRNIRMRQREEAMMEAYSSIPRENLEKLSQLFAEDCLLFDYSCDISRFLNHNAPKFYFRDL